jgi:hypothetical protein
VASHVSIQPVGLPTPLPVQPLPPVRAGVPSASASAGASSPAVVELRPTPESNSGPAPVPAPAPAPAPAPTAVGVAAPGPEAPTTEAPTATGVTFRVFARLSHGERIEVGAHGDEAAAKGEAGALMRFLKEDGSDWPFLDGRFVRPEAIVSVDVVAG